MLEHSDDDDQAADSGNPHPVDSTTRTCCGGIGDHAQDCDRYKRLSQAVEILAEDENVAAAELPFNGEGLRAFTADLIDARALDGLTEHDADWVAMLTCFDFCRGLPRFGWRISDMLKEKPTFTPKAGWDNEIGVLRAYVKIFYDLLGPFADAEVAGA